MADTVVSGTGEWSGEACCSGQLTITGSLTGSTMHLKLRFFDQNAPSAATPRFVEKVDATLQSNTSLLGTAQIDTLPLAKAQWRKGTNPF